MRRGMRSQGYRGVPRRLSPIGHHRGMSSAAEISSLSSTLAELHERVTALAEGALASGDEDMAHELDRGGAVARRRRCAACAASPRARPGR